MERRTRKKKFNWVWVALILSLAVFMGWQYFFAGIDKTQIAMEHSKDLAETNETQNQNKEVGDIERLPQVDAYLRYVTENNPEDNGIFDGNYTKNAFNHLTDALKGIAEQKEVKIAPSNIDSLKDQFDQFEQADEKTKPKQLKNVLTATNKVIESMEAGANEDYKNKLEKLQADVKAIDENTPVEKQSEHIEAYFEQAALVLEEVEKSI